MQFPQYNVPIRGNAAVQPPISFNYRQALSDRNALKALLSDGNTLADYDATLGVTGTLSATAIANQFSDASPLAEVVGSAPIYLPFSAEKYAYLPGISGHSLTTPNSAALGLVGKQSWEFDIALNDWTPAGATSLAQKWSGGANRGFIIQLKAGGAFLLNWTEDGATTKTIETVAANTITDGARVTLLCTLDTADGSLSVYIDGVLFETVAGAGATSVFNSTADYTIAGNNTGFVKGKIYRHRYLNAAGVAVADMMPGDSVETMTTGATFVSGTTGETWTLVSPAGAQCASIIGSSIVLCDGAATYLKATFASIQPAYDFAILMMPSWTINRVISDGVTANTGAIVKTTATPTISMNAGFAVAANGDLSLRTFHRGIFVNNGAGSSITIDGNAATTGDAGAGNPGGLTIGANGGAANFGSVWWKRWIRRKSSANLTEIAAMLKTIYGTP